MRSRELYSLVSHADNGPNAKAVLTNLMPAFRHGLAERGRSVWIEIEDEGQSYVICRSHLRNLCSWFLQGQIDEYELKYLADALSLSEDFEFEEEILERCLVDLSYSMEKKDKVRNTWRILNSLGSAASQAAQPDRGIVGEVLAELKRGEKCSSFINIGSAQYR